MNKTLNSSNSFEIHVTDEIGIVMFIARVSYDKESVFRNQLKLHITNTVLVGTGKGNTGANLEYQQTSNGYEMDYQEFVSIMNAGY